MTRNLTILATVMLCTGFAPAQAIHTFVYSTLEGLPSAVVNDVTQVEDDSIWVATDRGVARFDGRTWSVCEAPRETWRWIRVDPSGGAWLCGVHAEKGIARLGPDGKLRFRAPFPPSIAPLESPGPIAAHRFADGRSGLVAAMGESGFLIFVDGAWSRLESHEKIANVTAHAAIARPDGELWGCTDAGIVVWSADGETRYIQPTSAGAPDDDVLAVAFESTEEMLPWIVGKDWVGRLGANGAMEHLIRVDPFYGRPSIAADPPHGVYFGDVTALHHLDLATSVRRVLSVAEQMAGAGCHTIFRDRDHNFWVGCGRGATRIPPHRFHEFDSRHGLHEDEVTALEFVGDRVVFGHNFGLSWLEDGEFRTWTTPRERRGENCRVLDLEADGRGGVWFAANAAGLGRLHPDGEVSFFDDESLRAPIACVHVDADGELWRGTVGAGLERLDGADFVPVDPERFDGMCIRRIEAAPDGELFLATMRNGLFVGRPGAWRAITGVGAENVYAVSRYRGKTLLGTHTGLKVVTGDRCVPFRDGDFAVDHTTYALHVDPDGALWCGTDRGVFSWDGERWQIHTPHNGLAGREVNRDALTTGPAGRVWIGTESGLSLFLGDSPRPPRPPRVRITSATAGGEPIRHVETARVGSSDNTLVFRISAMSFVADGHVDVAWRLTGHDAGWRTSDSKHAQELIYSNLPAGRYRLEVRAANAKREWSDTVISPEIIVAAPLWQRPWFISSLVIAVVLLGWGLAAFVMARRQQARLEGIVRERTAELLALERELHRTEKLSAIGQLAGGVAHDFNNLLTAIVGSCDLIRDNLEPGSAVVRDLEPIEQAAHSGAELVEKLLAIGRRQTVHPEPTDINRSLLDLERLARRALGDRVNLDIHTAPEPVIADVDRGQLDHVLMNLLINARDAMPRGGRVTLSSSHEALRDGDVESLPAGRYACVTVRDEGVGIPDEVVGRIFEPFFTTKEPGRGTGLGLAMVYSAARQAGGDVTVVTATGVGTTFTLYLPRSSRRPAPPAVEREAGAQ